MAERLSVEQDVVGSSPTSLPLFFKSPNFRINHDLCVLNAVWQSLLDFVFNMEKVTCSSAEAFPALFKSYLRGISSANWPRNTIGRS